MLKKFANNNLMSVMLAVASLLSLGFFTSAAYKDAFTSYDSRTGLIPDLSEARSVVRECQNTTGFGDPRFIYSWRFSMMGNVAYFYCNIEEKIDWRERSRLDVYSTSPPQRYNWTTKVS